MSIKDKAFSRAGRIAAATLVALGVLVPAAVPLVAAVGGQVQTRSIEMSDSTQSKTGVTYHVTFTTSTANADSLVIDFCNDGSIIGSTCTPPVGFDALTVGPVGVANGTGVIANWTLTTTGTTPSPLANRVLLKDPSGTTANKLAATTAYSFDITGVRNSSALGTFWARIYTYNDDSFGSTTTIYSNATTLGDYQDYGGFALSTVGLINITATVMETLTFCINKTTITAACANASAPASLTLGSGTPKVLSITTGTGSEDTAFFQVSTNALTGAVIKMKTQNTCSGLSRDGGATCPIGAVGATADPITTANTAAFGVNVAADSALPSTIGTLLPQAPYSTASYYGMDDSTVGNQVQVGGGTKLATTSGGASADLGGVLTFTAEAAATTPAGVYSVNESLIATGTF